MQERRHPNCLDSTRLCFISEFEMSVHAKDLFFFFFLAYFTQILTHAHTRTCVFAGCRFESDQKRRHVLEQLPLKPCSVFLLHLISLAISHSSVKAAFSHSFKCDSSRSRPLE